MINVFEPVDTNVGCVNDTRVKTTDLLTNTRVASSPFCSCNCPKSSWRGKIVIVEDNDAVIKMRV